MSDTARKMTLWALAWPIFIEMFLHLLLGTADTLMVSRISDDAVAVVGIATQMFNAANILFAAVAAGAGVLISQRIGARQGEDARLIGIMTVKASLVIGIALSLALYFGASELAQLLQLEGGLLPLAEIYISIVGGGMVLTALMSTLSTVIRSTGDTQTPMYVAISMNVVHIALNYALIGGELGFPEMGLAGAAVSTVASRLLAVVVLYFVWSRAFERRLELRDWLSSDRSLMKEVLRLGWPLGLNMSSWFLSQLMIYTFVAMLGAKELAARTYMNTLESFCFMLGFSIALAVQIQIAYLFGAGRTEEAYRSTFRASGIGLVIVGLNALLLYALGEPILSIFTTDSDIVTMCLSLLMLNLILQPGKMVNMAFGNSLVAVGDTRFTMIISVLSMGFIATGLSYVLGIQWGWGLTGIYVAMIADEYLRGVLVVIRWSGRKMLTRGAVREPELERGKAALQVGE
ncbi:MATE family efflux transporter [Paenibacillus sp. YYML68]|uniref:MATE family efflux transporter n=1 Tax=Paenibacillus sp. YYML68 TaxID=2909250 RepID=UPI0024932995|nr:MATE family efflux transporter [Paenibacillus sp. YYML68]